MINVITSNFILRAISGLFILFIGWGIFSYEWIKDIFVIVLLLLSFYELNFFQPLRWSVVFYLAMIVVSCLSAFFFNRNIFFILLVCSWLHDTGGYVFGKLIGGPKILPSVSPNKTWAGFLGGWGMMTIFLFMTHHISYFVTPFEALLINAICLIGDLIESKLKRIYEIKDSSQLIPGHGGILDRFDAFLFLHFCFALYALLIGPWLSH